jgi:hypothetical protein
VAADFAINPAAARMRWSRLRKNIALNSSFKNDPNLPLIYGQSGGKGGGGGGGGSKGTTKRKHGDGNGGGNNKKSKFIKNEDEMDDDEIRVLGEDEVWMGKTEFKTEDDAANAAAGDGLESFAAIVEADRLRAVMDPLLFDEQQQQQQQQQQQLPRSASLEPLALRYVGATGRQATSLPPAATTQTSVLDDGNDIRITPTMTTSVGIITADSVTTIGAADIIDGGELSVVAAADKGQDANGEQKEKAQFGHDEEGANTNDNGNDDQIIVIENETYRNDQGGSQSIHLAPSDDQLKKKLVDMIGVATTENTADAAPAGHRGVHNEESDLSDPDNVVVLPHPRLSAAPQAAPHAVSKPTFKSKAKSSRVYDETKDELELLLPLGSEILTGGRLLRSQTGGGKKQKEKVEVEDAASAGGEVQQKDEGGGDMDDEEEDEMEEVIEEEYEDEDGSDGEWVE